MERIISIFLTTIGWGVGGAIGVMTSRGTIAGTTISPFGWATGALITALILYWANSFTRWYHALLVTAVWTVSWPFSLAFGSVIGGFAGAAIVLSSGVSEMGTRAFIVGVLIGVIIAGTGGGFITGLVLHWQKPSFHWIQILIVTIGWSIAWLIGTFISWMISRNIVSVIGWSISGAIGSSLMYWQLSQVSGRPNVSLASESENSGFLE